jgi:hypothetical protein
VLLCCCAAVLLCSVQLVLGDPSFHSTAELRVNGVDLQVQQHSSTATQQHNIIAAQQHSNTAAQ